MQRPWQIRDYDGAHDAAALHASFAELQDFERALEPDLPPGAEVASAYLPRLFERCTRWRGRIFVGVEEDGRVVGFVAVQAAVPQEEPDEAPGCYALLSDLVVLPEARRSGLGRALLDRAEAYARAEGAHVLSLSVLARNAGARSLYAAAGCRVRFVQLEKRLVPAGGVRA